MTIAEKNRWNQKHRERTHNSLVPDPLLVSAYDEFLSSATPGRALDLAGGVGRHAIWLAERGWQLKLLDISEVAIEQAQENAKQSKTENLIVTEFQDLDGSQNFGSEQYDLIMGFYFLQRKLFPALIAALKPGGHLIYKTYTTDNLKFGKGPSHPMFLLEPNELLRAFSSLRVLHYHETTQEKGVAELVARKISINTFEPRIALRLSIQRALLDQVTDRLISVTCGLDNHDIHIRAYFVGEVTLEDIERIQSVGGEVIADFPEGYMIEETCLSVTMGEQMLDFWAFRRAEEIP